MNKKTIYEVNRERNTFQSLENEKRQRLHEEKSRRIKNLRKTSR